jgi:phosphate transport system protein
LREQLLLMGSHVEAIIGASLRALLERDSALAPRTIEADRIVDRLEIEIDGLCLQILARRQQRDVFRRRCRLDPNDRSQFEE